MCDKRVLLVGVIFFSIIIFPLKISNASNEFTIVQNPTTSNIIINELLNITVINNQEVTIDTIFLFYCSFEPEFICHFPSLQMEKNSYGHFYTTFRPEYDVNTTFGYHLEINLVNGSSFTIPNSLTYPSDYNIRKGSDNNYYFELKIIESSKSSNTTPLILSIEWLIATLLIMEKKRT